MYKVGGFAELLPDYKILEEKMLDIIKKNYRQYGYTPIETPAVEKTDILTAKGGGEVKNQIFGVYGLAQGGQDLKDYSLHFDLTVPFSRYVLDYRGELSFPFKRSQIGKVWRGERQQRGRSKEFYQADIDVIWENSLTNNYLFYDAEVIKVALGTYTEIFDTFGLKTGIGVHINNRKIIAGFIASLGLNANLIEISIIIDKIDKISESTFLLNLTEITNDESLSKKILKFCKYETNLETLNSIKCDFEIVNDEFEKGINELGEVLKYLELLGISRQRVHVNLGIIRGLAYYTGTVFETFIDGDRTLGSIGSGGRYERLTTYIDSKTAYSGVGFSIGVTRLEEFLFDNIDKDILQKTTSEYLIIHFQDTIAESLKLYNFFIQNGKNIEIYPEADKLQKQFKYADKKGIQFCIIMGAEELENGIYAIKNMKTGETDELKIPKSL